MLISHSTKQKNKQVKTLTRMNASSPQILSIKMTVV